VRTLQELDYLLGVSDVSRLGALRFRHAGEEIFQSPTSSEVPASSSSADCYGSPTGS
jgi:serine/threonine-protein kinase HipA